MDPRLAQTLTQPSHDERAQLAKAQFDDFVGSKPSRQQLKGFMTDRAKVFYAEHAANVPRKLRRRAYRLLATQMQKKALNGELE